MAKATSVFAALSLLTLARGAVEWYPYSAVNWSTAVVSASPVCAQGHMQSPIDLPLCRVKDTTREAINITWGSSTVKLFNNEHTVQASVVGTAGKMVVGPRTYSLVQCHWHWGSEHTIDGVQQPLSLHCVHTKDTWPGRYGVLGIFYSVGSTADAFISSFQSSLPGGARRRLAETVYSFTGPLNWDLAYAGLNLAEYWTYKGSFTTPPCTEAVDWYPLMGKKTLTQAQLDLMKSAMGHADVGGNYRPPQPLFSRDIQGCVQEDWYPYKASSWSLRAGPASASDVCRAGKFQSPIDLPACEGDRVVSRPPITIAWGRQTVSLINNDHTVQLTIGGTPATPPKMSVGGASYSLLQCHFHRGSEHTVGGYQYPMAAHCVHSKDGTSRFGVLGVFFRVTSTTCGFLQPFEDQLPAQPRVVAARRLDEAPTVSAFAGPLDFDQLVQGIDLTHYWTYPGSLTTPPCTEAVDWYPLMGTQEMTKVQLDKFKAALGWLDEGGNFRPPQPRNGRLVEGCHMDWYPYDAAQWSKGLASGSPTCAAGHMQSPIDLPTCDETEERPALNVSWGTRTVQMVNNGHTVQLNVQADTGRGQMRLRSKSYTHVQCHWHSGSEHSVGGVQLPMAVHCVHTLDQQPGRYGVLGVLYQVGTAANAFLQPFQDALPQPPAEGSLTLSGNVSSDLDAIHAGLRKTAYWTYDGSFTTPPCTEAVDWYVLMDKATMTQQQLDKFKAAMGWASARGNFRPPQPLNGRTVRGCLAADWYPYDGNKWGRAVATPSLTCAAGAFQSPIDLPACEGDDIEPRTAIAISWGSLAVTLTNNGHTVQLTVPTSTTTGMTAGGAQYTLVQCHFHWGSEHTVGGQQFPLAVHCVHKKAGGTRFGVLGVMYEVSSVADGFLQLFEDKLPASQHSANLGSSDGDAAVATSDFKGPLDFDLLHASLDKSRYWTYPGSLTTPPCSELVDWYPLMTRAVLTQAQLAKFQAAIGWATAGGNYRPPQPRNGRLVEGCKLQWYPYDAGAWGAGADRFNEVCRSGHLQSPIDLPACAETQARNALVVSWGSKAVSIKNNGHTVQMSPAAGGGPGTLTAPDGKGTYTLAQCHWHWGSEHTVAVVQQDMVVHCVHTKDDSSGRYGVLGIFYQVGPTANTFIQMFEDQLPAQPAAEGAADVMSSFTSSVGWDGIHTGLNKTRYWSYDGSFTTPPCTEVVDWYVLMDKAPITRAQLGKFSEALGWRRANGNFRPPQPLYGRKVLGCVYKPWYPYDANLWSTAVASASGACATGNFQSPIDLPICNAPVDQPPLQTAWGAAVSVVLKHTGHGVQLSVAGTAGQMTAPNGDTYTLVQCHLHWGSENTVGGSQLDMEGHCVQSKDTDPGWFGVLSVFYKVALLGTDPNPFLASFDGSLPTPPTGEDEVVSNFVGPVNFDSIYSGLNMSQYWSYKGSLTTPPCAEVVDWFVLMGTIPIPQSQLNKFKTSIGSWGWAQAGNFRPPQPLNGRAIGGCDAAWVPTTTHATTASDAPRSSLGDLPLALALVLFLLPAAVRAQ